MPHIAIISASIREGRKSHHVALHLRDALLATRNTTDMLDLREFDLPLFHERLAMMKEPVAKAVEFGERIRRSDGVIIVTPEYNGGYPAALKNVIDLLTEDWKGRPVSICTVSSGAFAGTQVLANLLFPLWKIKAWVVPSSLQVPKVQEQFGEDGRLLMDQEGWSRRVSAFLNDLGWCIEARRRMGT